jgi:hypothetical protein
MIYDYVFSLWVILLILDLTFANLFSVCDEIQRTGVEDDISVTFYDFRLIIAFINSCNPWHRTWKVYIAYL